MKFGQYVRKIRKTRGIGLREMSRALNCSAAYISDIERSRRNPPGDELMSKFADVLGIDRKLLERSAAVSRDSIQLDIRDVAMRKAEFAYLLNRKWDSLDNSQIDELAKYLNEMNANLEDSR